MTINKNAVNIKKSIYYNNNICNTNIIKNLDISFNYNNIIQYKNFTNLNKKQIYSLFVNNINSNINRNSNNNFNINTNNNINISNNINSNRIISLYNNIFNNPNNPGYPNGIKYNDISQSLYCTKVTLDDFSDDDIRKYININNYKWFLYPDKKFENSDLTVRKKYPKLFSETNNTTYPHYTNSNNNILKNFIYNLNFKHYTKPQLYSYFANSINKKNSFFGSNINNPLKCNK